MAVSDDQPISAANLKAVIAKLKDEQAAISGTFIDYDEATSKNPQIGGNITFSYNKYGPSTFTFKDGGVFEIVEISAYPSSGEDGWWHNATVELPDGSTVGKSLSMNRVTLVSNRKVTIPANGKIVLYETSSYGVDIWFTVKINRVA